MALITRRRSASVLPTRYCNMPAPKSKPSSRTNMMSMKVKMAYQISIMGHLQFDGGGNRLRAVGDFAPDQKQIKHAENKIKPGTPHEREQDVAVTNHIPDALARAKELEDQPGLPAQFRRHPACRGGDVGKGEGQHEGPKQAA